MTMATMNVLMTIDHGGSDEPDAPDDLDDPDDPDDPDDLDDHNSKLSGVIKAGVMGCDVSPMAMFLILF